MSKGCLCDMFHKKAWLYQSEAHKLSPFFQFGQTFTTFGGFIFKAIFVYLYFRLANEDDTGGGIIFV